MKKTKTLALMLAMAMAVGSLAGCGGGSDKPAGGENKPAEGENKPADNGGEKVLNFGCAMYTDGVVNSVMDENGGWNAMRYGITECLFKFNDAMESVPWIAESYKVNDEHTVWTITLKKDYKFSNGTVVTPTKVKECFEYLKEKGPEGSAKPQKYLEFEATIEADDAANTVTITTSQPYANLIGQLSHPTMAIIDVAGTTDFDNGVIGTGPYMIDKFNGVGVGYSMLANPNYPETVPYDKVEIMFMGDNSQKTMALQSGQVDLVENITAVADIANFNEDPDYTVSITSGVRTGFTWLNCAGLFSNKALRQAVIMAVDDEAVCNSKTVGGLYTPGYSVLPSTLAYGYEKLNNPYKYDPEGAKKVLDDAGIVDTDGDGWRELDGKNIEIRYISYENRLLNDLADAFSMYIQEIGLKVVAEYGSSDDQWSKLAALDYDFNNNNWTTVGTGDPYAFLANWATDTTYCGYSNPEYDKLYAELAGEMDPDKRADLVFQMQQILIDDAAVLIEGYYNSSMIYSKNVGHAQIHTADYYWLSTEITPAN